MKKTVAENAKKEFIKHYTSIKVLQKILESKCLILGDPEKWPDKNDEASVRAFCRRSGEGVARVICFAQKETIRLWELKAGTGCCISFKKEAFLKKLKNPPFLHGEVKYFYGKGPTASYLKSLKTEKLPFLKRASYECEKEYRVVWFGPKNKTKEAKIELDMNDIGRVLLGPRVKDKDKIKEQFEKYGVKVHFCRIEDSKEWISKFNQIGK
jgi:hypothetical protein